jgi:hypothetical protein
MTFCRPLSNRSSPSQTSGRRNSRSPPSRPSGRRSPPSSQTSGRRNSRSPPSRASGRRTSQSPPSRHRKESRSPPSRHSHSPQSENENFSLKLSGVEELIHLAMAETRIQVRKRILKQARREFAEASTLLSNAPAKSIFERSWVFLSLLLPWIEYVLMLALYGFSASPPVTLHESFAPTKTWTSFAEFVVNYQQNFTPDDLTHVLVSVSLLLVVGVLDVRLLLSILAALSSGLVAFRVFTDHPNGNKELFVLITVFFAVAWRNRLGWLILAAFCAAVAFYVYGHASVHSQLFAVYPTFCILGDLYMWYAICFNKIMLTVKVPSIISDFWGFASQLPRILQ